MQRSEWTPLGVATALVALAVLLLVLVTSQRFGDDDSPGVGKPRRRAPAEVTLWVGEIVPGLKGALTDVYGDAKPDLAHDERLNETLGLAGDEALAFYRLLLFNTTGEDVSFPVRVGGLAVGAGVGGDRASLTSLPGILAGRSVVLDGGTRFALESLGTLREAVAVPAGAMANLVVAFDRRSDLAQARVVETAEGTRLERRQMSRAAFRRLVANPRAEWIKDL